MAEYIEREATIRELRDVYEREFPTADGAFDLFANRIVPRVIRNIPAIEVAHRESIYVGWGEAWCEWGYCTNCNGANIIDAKYCNWCGAKLSGVKRDETD